MSQTCPVCSKEATNRCSICKSVKYCSLKCQGQHWKDGHKIDCKRLAAENERSEAKRRALAESSEGAELAPLPRQAGSDDCISPRPILVRLRKIAKHMTPGQQEDSHEFFNFLLDSLESVQLAEAGGKEKYDTRSCETTALHHMFYGYIRNQTECAQCGSASKRFEASPFLTLHLGPSVQRIEDALDAYFADEVMDGDNKYECESCKEHVRAVRGCRLETASNVLVLSLKRFGLGRFGKINRRVIYDEVLDMEPYLARDALDTGDATYRLYGVVVHLDSMNSTQYGHYISYVRLEDGRWFRCDDEAIVQVPASKALSHNAYMLFYLRDTPRSAPKLRPPPAKPAAASPRVKTPQQANGHVTMPNGAPHRNGAAATAHPDSPTADDAPEPLQQGSLSNGDSPTANGAPKASQQGSLSNGGAAVHEASSNGHADANGGGGGGAAAAASSPRGPAADLAPNDPISRLMRVSTAPAALPRLETHPGQRISLDNSSTSSMSLDAGGPTDLPSPSSSQDGRGLPQEGEAAGPSHPRALAASHYLPIPRHQLRILDGNRVLVEVYLSGMTSARQIHLQVEGNMLVLSAVDHYQLTLLLGGPSGVAEVVSAKFKCRSGRLKVLLRLYDAASVAASGVLPVFATDSSGSESDVDGPAGVSRQPSSLHASTSEGDMAHLYGPVTPRGTPATHPPHGPAAVGTGGPPPRARGGSATSAAASALGPEPHAAGTLHARHPPTSSSASTGTSVPAAGGANSAASVASPGPQSSTGQTGGAAAEGAPGPGGAESPDASGSEDEGGDEASAPQGGAAGAAAGGSGGNKGSGRGGKSKGKGGGKKKGKGGGKKRR